MLFKDWSFCFGVDIDYWDCEAGVTVTPSGQGPFGKVPEYLLGNYHIWVKILFSTKWVTEIFVYFKVEVTIFFKIEQR